MQTRRTFLKQAGLLSSSMALMNFSAFKAEPLIGLQLYTLRKEIAKEGLESVLSKTASIGYNSLEVFGFDNSKFFGKTPQEFSTLLKQNKLKSPSGHYMMLDFLKNDNQDVLKKNIDAAVALGHDFIVIPFLMDDMRTSLDDYKRLAARLNTGAEKAKEAGLKFAYHNHNFEFKDWGNGQTGFEIFRKETDPSLVFFEMDIYWVVKSGIDPVKLIQDNPGRIKLWHTKDSSVKGKADFSLGGKQTYTEVGSGVIDFKEIFKHKKESGMEYFYVEQDETSIPVYESIAKSYAYVHANLAK